MIPVFLYLTLLRKIGLHEIRCINKVIVVSEQPTQITDPSHSGERLGGNQLSGIFVWIVDLNQKQWIKCYDKALWFLISVS